MAIEREKIDRDRGVVAARVELAHAKSMRRRVVGLYMGIVVGAGTITYTAADILNRTIGHDAAGINITGRIIAGSVACATAFGVMLYQTDHAPRPLSAPVHDAEFGLRIAETTAIEAAQQQAQLTPTPVEASA